jgi:cyclase
MQRISPNVYAETGWPPLSSCNPGFLATAEGIILIDTPGRPVNALQWQEEIRKRGEIRYILYTEFHEDHTAGNAYLPGISVGHQETKKGLDGYITNVQAMREKLTRMFPEDRALLLNFQHRTLDITFSDRLSVYLDRQRCDLINLPGHTLGQTAVYLPGEKVAFLGDNFTNGMQPSLSYCFPKEWVESLRTILSLDVEWVVPGHGKVGDKKDVERFAEFLQECIAEVQQAIDRGMGREEAAQRISFENRLPAIHPGAEQQRKNVLRLYEMLSQ